MAVEDIEKLGEDFYKDWETELLATGKSSYLDITLTYIDDEEEPEFIIEEREIVCSNIEDFRDQIRLYSIVRQMTARMEVEAMEQE